MQTFTEDYKNISFPNMSIDISQNISVLNGTWEGQSIKTVIKEDGSIISSVTGWKQVVLTFWVVSDTSIELKGSGTSEWKGNSIPFVLNGTINRQTLDLELTKSHISARFSNKITYNGRIDINEKKMTGDNNSFELKMMSIVSDHRTRESIDSMFRVPRETYGGPVQATVHTIHPFIIPHATSYNPGFFSAVNTQQTLSRSQTLFRMAERERDREKYKEFLYRIIFGTTKPTITNEIIKIADDYTRVHNLTRQDHELTLSELNIPVQNWVYSFSFSEPEKPKQVEKEKTECIVCFDNKINTVFVPCGHMVSCGDCGKKLNKCPVCRAHVSPLQVYFA